MENKYTFEDYKNDVHEELKKRVNDEVSQGWKISNTTKKENCINLFLVLPKDYTGSLVIGRKTIGSNENLFDYFADRVSATAPIYECNNKHFSATVNDPKLNPEEVETYNKIVSKLNLNNQPGNNQ